MSMTGSAVIIEMHRIGRGEAPAPLVAERLKGRDNSRVYCRAALPLRIFERHDVDGDRVAMVRDTTRGSGIAGQLRAAEALRSFSMEDQIVPSQIMDGRAELLESWLDR